MVEVPVAPIVLEHRRMWAAGMEELSRTLARQLEPLLLHSNKRPKSSRKVSYREHIQRFAHHIELLWRDYAQQSYAPPAALSFRDPLYDHQGLKGDEVLQRMRLVAQLFPDAPTPSQWRIIEGSLCAMAALIFSEEWDRDRQAIMDRLHWQDYHGILAVLTPRKFGKTTCLAYIIIMILFCISGARVLLVSRTRPQAMIGLDMVRSLLVIHPLLEKWGFKLKEFRATAVTIEAPDGSRRTVEVRSGEATVSGFYFVLARLLARSRGGKLHYGVLGMCLITASKSERVGNVTIRPPLPLLPLLLNGGPWDSLALINAHVTRSAYLAGVSGCWC
jgi:hypothetical protein